MMSETMSNKPETGPALKKQPAPRPCPICRQPATERFRPFCSRRCADIDLGRWFKGSYAISDDRDGEGLGGVGEKEDGE